MKKTKKATKSASTGNARSSARTIAARVTEPTDWRTTTLSRIRTLIHQAFPEAIEEVKWRKPSNQMAGVPVWSHNGIICTGETYKNAVKLTFAKGAALADPSRLFISSLEGNTRRAMDIHEGDKINESAFKAIGRAAAALKAAGTGKPTGRGAAPSRSKSR